MKQRLLIVLFLLLTATGNVAAEPVAIRILHINDFHGFANPTKQTAPHPSLGGAARLAKQINDLRSQKNGLLLVAGDVIQGDTWANLSQGKSSIELMNQLGVDAMVTGNHEFDFGLNVLKKRIAEADFPVLAANIVGFPCVHPRIYFNRQGARIAVVGLVTEDTPQSSHPRNTVGLTFGSPLETAREQISEAEATADLVVLLTHLGYEKDRALAEALCSGPSPAPLPVLIVGGHSHTRLEQPFRIGNCAVVQAWEHGKTLGIVDLAIDQGRLVELNARLLDITPALGKGDPKVAALVERYNRSAAGVLGRTVGIAAIDLVQQGVRQRETNLGNLIADTVRQATGAQTAIVNGGSIRTGIPKGPITARQIYATLPFNNYLVAVRMTGKQLQQTLEHGVSGIRDSEGRFPQVSGIRFSFNPAQPVGRRVVAVEVDGKPLQPAQEYTVATLDFIAAGGDGYTAFGEAIRGSGDFSETAGAMRSSRLVYNDPGRFLRDVVLETLTARKSVAPRIEGRITELR